ncbi:MAG: ABC transporter permease [Dehalococcoidales bacterium]|nr:ABC transporter permease [Dehalococcoidales bacterium]
MSTIGFSKPIDKAHEKKPHSFLVDLGIRLVKEKPLGTFGGVVVLAMLFIGIFANFVAPYGVNDINAKHMFESPSGQFLFGTDQLGRDLLSRVIYGARISMVVGVAAPAINLVVALLLGVISGFIGGRLDLLIQRFVDAWMCFPSLIILLTVMSILGPGLLQVVVVLGISGGIASSRTIRSAVIGIKQNTYVEAASAVGSPIRRILIYHILPNIMPVVIILFTVNMAYAILAEASLSFLGFGVPPPNPSWGGMLSGAGRKYMLKAPWMALWPGVALSIAVYGISMLGDALRDLLDPRLRGGLGRYGSQKIKKPKAFSAR